MADYKDTIKHYHRTIEGLEDTIDDKNIELRLLESERQDDFKPSQLGVEISYTVMEMIMEILEFEKLKGSSTKTQFSKNRLIGLLNSTEGLNTLANQLYTLKLVNRELYAGYRATKEENIKLKQQLKRIEDAEKY